MSETNIELPKYPTPEKSTAKTPVSNPKLSIDDLKYIVMEGGGARGNTYLGAISELEVRLAMRVNDTVAPQNVKLIARAKPGIMDFLTIANASTKETKPIIEGMAGASAGAITTFALLLGLNSEEIETVLDFDFSRFLVEVDAGKYRMVDENSELKVAEDKTIYNAPETVFETGQKKLGGKRDDFKYDLTKNSTTIHGNPVKFAKRGLLVSFIAKVVLDGVLYNIGQLYRFFSNRERPGWFMKWVQKVFGANNANSKEGGINFLARTLLSSSGLLVIFYGFFRRGKKGMKVNANSILGTFLDRGMYSGFQVREFFFDLMIFAATRDTFFQKQLIKCYQNLSEESFKVTLKKKTKDNDSKEFRIGYRGEYEFTSDFINLINNHLNKITFRELWEILGVEYACAVSNFTTNSPLYFSNKYTPDFPVLEAVSASMSIPPAIRPLYNAANVLNKSFKDGIFPGNTTSEKISKNLSVKVDNEPVVFINGKGEFARSDYDFYEYVTKKAMQELIENKSESIYIDLNNVIELNTFLNYMQSTLIGVEVGGKNDLILQLPHTVEVNGVKYEVTMEMLAFFYNAQFKGLLIDGGYFTNIPFNYFREKGDVNKLDNVLAIKLDRSYPPDFMKKVEEIMKPLKDKEKEIIERWEREQLQLGKIIPWSEVDTSEFDIQFEKVIIQIQSLLGAKILNEKKRTVKRMSKDKEQKLSEEEEKRLKGIAGNFRANRQNILQIIEEWYTYYGAYNQVKPWEIPRPIFSIAFTGYSYGAKRGQIRDMTDHKHIISLYDYGVGTYDFDLDKVRPLAEFAQEEARNDMCEYFENP
ncbi:MAG: patatin-like phospholipase family protein [Tannerella sp.]|jgi:predicted acylesterase/phospholipase RssA|nr:patatin-like phospholipase family protein [Tannerella sp.]